MNVLATLSTHEAYERWAASYPPVPHNPLMRAEQAAMLQHWPGDAGDCALDLACGTGRYARLLAARHAATVISLDFSAAMLQQAPAGCRVRANMLQLPFASHSFGFVVAGLAVGHAADIRALLCEIGRALAPGGVLLYSDFHPEAARAGMTRSFKDQHGHSHVVPHCRHELAAHRAAADAAGLTIDVVNQPRVGFEFQETFDNAAEFYRRWHGLPLVLVVRARKR